MVVRRSGERRAVAAEDDRLEVTRGPDGTLVVRLAGAWSLESGLPGMKPVEQALAADPPPRAVTFDTEALGHWNSGVLAFLTKVDDLATQRGVKVDHTALPKGPQRLLILAGSVSEKQGTKPPARPASLLARLGAGAIAAWEQTLNALAFLGDATMSFGR